MDYKEELSIIEKKIETEKTQKIRLEEQLKQLDKENKEISENIEQEGIEEKNLDSTIEELEIEIEEEIGKCQQILG